VGHDTVGATRPRSDDRLEIAVRYWLYKNNTKGGPAGYWGDWLADVFPAKAASEWGGHYATMSAEVAGLLDHEMSQGDVVVAYQTDTKSVVGFLRITTITGPPGDKKLYLRRTYRLPNPFLIHKHKHGTSLETSAAVKGPVTLRELHDDEMADLIRLSGAPRYVLKGGEPAGGYRP